MMRDAAAGSVVMTGFSSRRGALHRRALLAAPFAMIPASALAQDAPTIETPERLRGGRLSTPVFINGRGPFDFAVDSAANASVIAQDLAESLSLAPAGPIAMHTLIAREVVETVRAPRVRSGALESANVRFALAPRLGLNGADGLIGSDLLAGHRLVLNFRGVALATISQSRREGDSFLSARRPTARFQTPTDERLNGLLMIDVRSRTARAKAIIDTGAEVTIVNTAFARAAGASPITLRDGSRSQRVASPTGLSVDAAAVMLPNLHLAGIGLEQVPALAGDFHTFEVWGLADQPAALLGVDVLGLFETAIIDLKRGELVLEL